ncbi:MAG TPA: hypothetical protein VMW25_06620 [Clostridia bacterium]|nr:hypothetical protein [Clostridia bacterium]
MKKIKKLLLYSLVLVLGLFVANNVFSAWSYEQNFNTLTTGNLEGQDSWYGDPNFKVIEGIAGVETYEGSKALSHSVDDSGWIARPIATSSEGIIYYAFKKSSFQFYGWQTKTSFQDSENKIVFEIKLVETRIQLGDYTVLWSDLVANQWYVLGIEYDTINNRQRVKRYTGLTGGVWTDWTDWISGATAGAIVKVQLYRTAGGWTATWDTFTSNDPTPPPPPTYTILPVADQGITASSLAYVGRLFTDVSPIVYLWIGLVVGFVVLNGAIGIFSRRHKKF